MNKLKRSQILLSLLASLLIVTPLLSSSLRPTYLYFIINLLIIALGAESGLLSSLLSNPNPSSGSEVERKSSHVALISPHCSNNNIENHRDAADVNGAGTQENERKRPVKVVEKCNSEKVVGGLKAIITNKVKRSPSTPSIFFIGGGDAQSPRAAPAVRDRESDVIGEDGLEEEAEGIGRQDELFAKAEIFIGNFYKQLKMQREESWKKIHGLYQKSF